MGDDYYNRGVRAPPRSAEGPKPSWALSSSSSSQPPVQWVTTTQGTPGLTRGFAVPMFHLLCRSGTGALQIGRGATRGQAGARHLVAAGAAGGQISMEGHHPGISAPGISAPPGIWDQIGAPATPSVCPTCTGELAQPQAAEGAALAGHPSGGVSRRRSSAGGVEQAAAMHGVRQLTGYS